MAQASSRADNHTQLNRVYKRQITVRPFVLDENWPGFDVLCEENEVSFVRISPVKFMSSLFLLVTAGQECLSNFRVCFAHPLFYSVHGHLFVLFSPCSFICLNSYDATENLANYRL